ncbi:RNA-binding transcriptional accessory protein [Metabacillus sp. KIGAM252]|uniref:RNA-binding transcriptional accessory protein n=1 Tax=Metabacillus flavus TaxID=2823519 RepID=A0ABS5L9S1_9BACI|nr:Tex family protein [Metabacillus flavus]MBS2967471.1 RNA-binding transcriptional accessory protein [Metabacillus flavus]
MELENQERLLKLLTENLKIPYKQVKSVIALLEEGNTVPFIARYRKEMTGALDEVQIRDISESWQYMLNLEGRKAEVIRLIEEQGKLTDELKKDIAAAVKLQQVEDLYRPYKQKRRTKATAAKEKGLEPLAEWIMQLPASEKPEQKAKDFIDADKGVETAEDALQGAKDIIAEKIADEPAYRKWIREQSFKKGMIVTAAKDKEKDEKNVFEMYYDYEEPVQKAAPHRVLAMNRGEKEDILRISVKTPADQMLAYLIRQELGSKHTTGKQLMEEAIEDAYKRLIEPSVEREIRKELTEKADAQAIHIFSENLRNLLLQPPLKGRVVLGLDPAYRTGCKLAVVSETGKVLHIGVIYPHAPVNKREEALQTILKLIDDYQIEVIAVGNGTASRESEQLAADAIQQSGKDLAYLIVNEAGASVYSASDLAREEFPDLKVEERSAVSIARRLQDPLAELVKIDPKSVGVGQYQHDVSQKNLNESLTFVVETVVNRVGVNVNTASPALLQYVSGLSKTVAQNIVKKREELGKITSRTQLKGIPRLGAKTYEQAVGFLRVIDGDQPLDRTSIHPESYKVVTALLMHLDTTYDELGSESLKEKIKNLDIKEASAEFGVGELTLKDICDALVQPGRDPRDEVAKPLLKKNVLKLEDLSKGLELQGTVRNVVDFGAFVDIGVKQDGLVHISKLSRQYVKHPLDVVSVGDVVTVWVDSVDVHKGRVSLTMLSDQ